MRWGDHHQQFQLQYQVPGTLDRSRQSHHQPPLVHLLQNRQNRRQSHLHRRPRRHRFVCLDLYHESCGLKISVLYV